MKATRKFSLNRCHFYSGTRSSCPLHPYSQLATSSPLSEMPQDHQCGEIVPKDSYSICQLAAVRSGLLHPCHMPLGVLIFLLLDGLRQPLL